MIANMISSDRGDSLLLLETRTNSRRLELVGTSLSQLLALDAHRIDLLEKISVAGGEGATGAKWLQCRTAEIAVVKVVETPATIMCLEGPR